MSYSTQHTIPDQHRGTSTATRATAASVVAVALIAGAFFVGRSTKTEAGNPAQPSTGLPLGNGVKASTLNFPHGPTRFSGVLPVGFTKDRGGALSAAAVASETLTDYVQSRRSLPAAQWISTYTTGQLSNLTMQRIYSWRPLLDPRVNTPGFRPTDFGPVSLNPATGEYTSTPGVALTHPVGYQLVSLTSSAAHVRIWLHGEGWRQGATRPNAAIFIMLDEQMVWSAGDWKLTSVGAPPGAPWPGGSFEDPAAQGYAPWPGGQFTFITG